MFLWNLTDIPFCETYPLICRQERRSGLWEETGAGKTSVIHVLQRFYDVTGGKVLLDGKDIRKLPLHPVRRSIALVMQDVFLFSDTVGRKMYGLESGEKFCGKRWLPLLIVRRQKIRRAYGKQV